MHKSSVTSDHEQGLPDDIKKIPLNSLTGIFCQLVYFHQMLKIGDKVLQCDAVIRKMTCCNMHLRSCFFAIVVQIKFKLKA